MDRRKKSKSVILAVRGILYLPEKEGCLMLKRAPSYEGDPLANYWELPGGKFDAGDLYVRTALVIEFLEETGIPISTINDPLYIWDAPDGIDKYEGNHYLCIFYSVNLVYPNISDVTLNKKEHSEYKWVKIPEDMKNLDGKGVHNETRRALDRFYLKYLAFPETIKKGIIMNNPEKE